MVVLLTEHALAVTKKYYEIHMEIGSEMITYEVDIKVNLYNKHIGNIKQVDGGYQYFAKGHKTGGEIFLTLDKCKQSLENCDD
jgi:hypothetical protein